MASEEQTQTAAPTMTRIFGRKSITKLSRNGGMYPERTFAGLGSSRLILAHISFTASSAFTGVIPERNRATPYR